MPVYKIAIVGDGGVGKSSILEAKKSNTFDQYKKITIGVDFKLIPLEIKDEKGKESTFLTMDLGGQERFHFIHDAYIKGIKGAIILFDVTRMKSFDNIPRWNELIRLENPDIPILVIGNKIDLVEDEEIQLYINDLEELKNSHSCYDKIEGFCFTSAKQLKGVAEAFKKCEEMIIQRKNNCK